MPPMELLAAKAGSFEQVVHIPISSSKDELSLVTCNSIFPSANRTKRQARRRADDKRLVRRRLQGKAYKEKKVKRSITTQLKDQHIQ